jgi:formylglycine-generating enzyme required for sulfatase activity
MAAVYANAITQYHNDLYGTALQECYLCSGTNTSATCSQTVNPYSCTGYRLLTEAEWEYTARAGDSAAFWTPSGSGELPSGYTNITSTLTNGFDLQSYALYKANNTGTSQPVAQLLPNDYGVYDMSGNVLEWVHDYYGAYSTGSVTDPVTELGSYRVLRGGYWGHTPANLRSAYRSSNTPATRSLGAGFRLVYIP